MTSPVVRLLLNICLTAVLIAASYWIARYFSVMIRGTAWQGLLRGTFWNELRFLIGGAAVFVFLSISEMILGRVFAFMAKQSKS